MLNRIARRRTRAWGARAACRSGTASGAWRHGAIVAGLAPRRSVMRESGTLMPTRGPQQPFAVTIRAVENGWHWCVLDHAGESVAAGLSSDQAIAHARANAVMAQAGGRDESRRDQGGTSFSP